MKKTIFCLLLVAFGRPATAQTGYDAVLKEIETNSIALKALREQTDAQKLENRTGIFSADPEVSFNYLWGNPSGIGNRTDFSVTQSFDIPTITGMRSQIAAGQNNLAELQYQSERINLLLEAKHDCIELIYHNALKKELNVRLRHAVMLADGYKERLERGDINQLEYNKVLLNLSSVQGEIARTDVERNALLSELKRLNGGVNVTLEEAHYGEVTFPADFEDWYALAEQKNPVLEYVRQETEIGKKRVSLSKAMGWPTFSAGYMSEKIVGQQYQGITLDISIPLWENRNRVRQAKAAVRAAETRQTDRKQQFYSRLRTLYDRANGLRLVAEGYRKALATLNNTELLKKALDAGEISLLDYTVEIGLYYDTVNRTLDAERDFQKAFAELAAVEL
ncbi:MAG: TolC family protein [Tannerella sp.]|jgi:outer membrane protein TolC|nr:TolC family protein [Tannerella sp.]